MAASRAFRWRGALAASAFVLLKFPLVESGNTWNGERQITRERMVQVLDEILTALQIADQLDSSACSLSMSLF
jgi:hypothetical protein